mmetsp:Transcript_6174/g.12250  ORF Transcript_6174/g.12250 Transcript_6174/m.12250 type:complete len:323 (-) Transcript_6174:1305-2273(-)
MEESQPNPHRPPNSTHAFLSLVKLPDRCKTARILSTVGVTEHDLLAAIDAVRVPWDREESLEVARRVVQVRLGLEQRSNAHRRVNSCFLLEEFDGEDVRGCTCHRNDVGTKARWVGTSDHLERVKNLAGIRRTREVPRNQGAWVLQLLDEKFHLFRLVPLRELSSSNVRANLIHSQLMPSRLLPYVQCQEMHAKALEAANHVLEAAVSDGSIATFVERAVHELEKRHDLFTILIDGDPWLLRLVGSHVGRVVPRTKVVVVFLKVALGTPEPHAKVRENGTVGFRSTPPTEKVFTFVRFLQFGMVLVGELGNLLVTLAHREVP